MPDSPQILVIAPHGSYRTSAFISAAQRLGVRVLIASEGKHSIVSDYAQGLHIDLADAAGARGLILQAAEQTPFAGIIGTDDSTVELAAQCAAALDLVHNPPYAVRLGRRKDQARACLEAAGLNVPPFRRLDLESPLSRQLQGLDYPVVVKPVGLSASRGVIRANTETDLRQAVARIQIMLHKERFTDPDLVRWLLVEQYIPGQEVALEGMLYEGQLEVLTVFDKPDPLEGPYFEETYYTTPSRHPTETLIELERQVRAACKAYGLRSGPVHAECRIGDHEVTILEVAARSIGGLCGRLLQFGTGYNLEELVLAQAMGQRLPVTPSTGGAGVLMIPVPQAGILKRVEGLLMARRIPGIESIDIQIRDGHELVPLPEGASYLGFIFASGDTPEQAETALRQAHASLNIVIAPLWKARVA